MLESGAYDVFEFPFPSQGINQNVDRDGLDASFGWWIENILPEPLGSGTVRYGTQTVPNMVFPPTVASILEAFPFFYQNQNQIVFYANVWTEDITSNRVALDPNTVRFTSAQASRYQPTLKIQVVYTMPNDLQAYVLSTDVKDVQLDGTTVTLGLGDNRLPAGVASIVSVQFGDGQIFVWNGVQLVLQKTGLSTVCVPRSVLFQNKRILCNGVDRLLSWDGANLTDVFDWVKETGLTGAVRVSDTVFTATVNPALCTVASYVGNRIRLQVNGVSSEWDVQAATLSNTVLTITVAGVLPVFQNPVELFYRAWPPRMNYLMAAHDRLWGLGEGPVSLKYRRADQAMVVYYAYRTLSTTAWFNETTRTVPFLDLGNKQDVPDNLEAMTTLGTLTIFFGRHQTQVWSGHQPPISQDLGNFKWIANKGVGIAHGNLLLNCPNDLYFVSHQGILSAGTLNIGNQLAVDSSAAAVNPLVRQFIDHIVADESAYRCCRAWIYSRGRIAAFKIGMQKVLACRLSTRLESWFLLSGDFEQASTIWEHLDANLYLAIGHQLYQYGDSRNVVPSYGDRGGTHPIPFIWSLPTVVLPGRRIALKRFELLMNYPVNFTDSGSSNSVQLLLFGDLRKSFATTVSVPVTRQGDSINSKLLALALDGVPDASRYHLGRSYAPLTGRLSCIGSRLEPRIEGVAQSGPLVFHKLRLFSLVEQGR